MTTFALTLMPILKTLENGGEINFKILSNELIKLDPRRFRDLRCVEEGIDHYTACLTFKDEIVRYNKDSKNYAKFSIMERDIQAILHEAIKNMEEFQLYPFKTRKNSDKCYIGIKWKDIPKDNDGLDKSYNSSCNYRKDGLDECHAGCRVKEDVLRLYGLL